MKAHVQKHTMCAPNDITGLPPANQSTIVLKQTMCASPKTMFGGIFIKTTTNLVTEFPLNDEKNLLKLMSLRK